MSYSFALNRAAFDGEINEVPASRFPVASVMPLLRGPFISARDLSINISFNHAWYFHEVLGERGVEVIYGKTAREVEPLLKAACERLDGMIAEERKTKRVLSKCWVKEGEDGYDETMANDDPIWYVSAINAKRAIEALLVLGEVAPDFTWGAYLDDEVWEDEDEEN